MPPRSVRTATAYPECKARTNGVQFTTSSPHRARHATINLLAGIPRPIPLMLFYAIAARKSTC
eukprot:4306716-Pleurochrysis_carterae.AAC.1